jgi:hypothetical protein
MKLTVVHRGSEDLETYVTYTYETFEKLMKELKVSK